MDAYIAILVTIMVYLSSGDKYPGDWVLNDDLDFLLSLNGLEYTYDNGYWYKIEASLTTKTVERPHGIRYNLTFHDNYNKRIFGMDNAHGIKSGKKY